MRRIGSLTNNASAPGEILSRRDCIRFAAGIGAGSLLPFKHSFAAERSGGGCIDLHHHFVSRELMGDIIEKQPNPQPMRDYTPERSLEAMDRAGIATAFLSSPFEDNAVELPVR